MGSLVIVGEGHAAHGLAAPRDEAEPPLFRVLGPFEVCVDGRALQLGGPRIRTLIALLTSNAGRVMRIGTIADALWGMDAPPDAARTVRTYVSRLRRSLSPVATAAGELIVTHRVGYTLRLAPGALDAAQFEHLVAIGRDALAASQHADAVTRLNSALALWRGDAYEEFADVPLLSAEAARLDALRLAAIEDRIDAELAIGSSLTLVDELTALTQRYPGHGRLWGQLMIALYRAGRQADSLAVFSHARHVFAERFGLDPSPGLLEIHQQVLNNDLRLGGEQKPPINAGSTDLLAHQRVRNDLPGDIADFAGRKAELVRLPTERTGVPEVTPTAVVIEAIDGMAGVGKTTLAVHAAHRLAAHYRDAQLFIDLHGHTPGQPPMTPMAALDLLLRALGVPSGKIPDDPNARAALWRAELAERSALVVLDNAADVAQIRPLLPGTARSLVLITSRRRLVGLESVNVVTLDVLPEPDAVALFTGIVGNVRADDPGSVRGVVEQCGYLPLAIRLAAARLRARPAWTVRYLAERLRQACWPVADLEFGDRSVAATFALSYEHLDPAAQRIFRLLGLHPGVDFDASATAALAAVAVAEAERLLESLVDDHLLHQPTAGRYRFHDLLRRHAHTTALAEEAEPARSEALHRVVDFYLHTAYRGSRLLDQHHSPIDLDPPAPGCVPHPLHDAAAALTWFDTEHPNLLAAQHTATTHTWHHTAWLLAWSLTTFHHRQGHLHDQLAVWRTTVDSAAHLPDPTASIRAHRQLGYAYADLNRHEDAIRHLHHALTLAEHHRCSTEQALTHRALSWTCERRGDLKQALDHDTRALAVFRAQNQPVWEAVTLNEVGWDLARLGDYDTARAHCQAALTLHQQHRNHHGEAVTLDSLGYIAHHTGHHHLAIRYYHQALPMLRDLGHTYMAADALDRLGHPHYALGHHDHARTVWQEAVRLYRKQGRDDDSARVQRHLHDLDQHDGNGSQD
jgi:DNA-binding SARP family transcriptional activator/Tfp pilus assembly protein PilF